jgi:excisionase family DNA binding protein
MAKELLDAKEADAYLSLDIITVYKLAQQWTIPSLRTGRNCRFGKETLDDWMMHKSSVRKLSTLITDDEAIAGESLMVMGMREGHAVATASILKASLKKINRRSLTLSSLVYACQTQVVSIRCRR